MVLALSSGYAHATHAAVPKEVVEVSGAVDSSVVYADPVYPIDVRSEM